MYHPEAHASGSPRWRGAAHQAAESGGHGPHAALASFVALSRTRERVISALITDSAALCAGLLTPHSDDRSVSRCMEAYGRVSARSGDLRRARSAPYVAELVIKAVISWAASLHFA